MIATFNGEKLLVKHAEELIGFDGLGEPVFRMTDDERAWIHRAWEEKWKREHPEEPQP